MKDKKNMQIPCPSCLSTNTKVSKNRVISAFNIALIFMGGLFIALALLMTRPDAWSPKFFNLLKLFGLVIGPWIIWEQITGVPIPLLGIKLFKETYTVRGVCPECQHKWQVQGVKEE